MNPRDIYNAALARQLRRPNGFVGRFIAGRLNKSNQTIVAAAIEALELKEGSVVADVGFGGGVGLRLLLDRHEVSQAIGVDFSETMVAAARDRFAAEIAAGRLRLEAGSLTGLPLEDACLDGAITVNTVYFLDDLVPALREFARTLRPGGRLVVGIGDPDEMEKMAFTAHGFQLRSIPTLEASIAESGLELADHRRAGGARVKSHLLVASRPLGEYGGERVM